MRPDKASHDDTFASYFLSCAIHCHKFAFVGLIVYYEAENINKDAQVIRSRLVMRSVEVVKRDLPIFEAKFIANQVKQNG